MWISLILHSFLFSLRYPGWSWAPECQEIRGLVTKQDTWSSYSDLCTWPQEYMPMHICNMYRYIHAQNAYINRKRKTLLKIDLWSSKITRSQVYEFLIIILCFTFFFLFCFLRQSSGWSWIHVILLPQSSLSLLHSLDRSRPQISVLCRYIMTNIYPIRNSSRET